MAITQETMLKRSFDAPDETRAAGTGKAEIINVGDMAMMRLSLPAGWRWSRDLKEIAGTDSCLAPHFQYVVSGRLGVRMDDGSEDEFGPGDLSVLPPGHDAWVVGDETCVTIDVTGAHVWATHV
jgi:hypothetical protein